MRYLVQDKSTPYTTNDGVYHPHPPGADFPCSISPHASTRSVIEISRRELPEDVSFGIDTLLAVDYSCYPLGSSSHRARKTAPGGGDLYTVVDGRSPELQSREQRYSEMETAVDMDIVEKETSEDISFGVGTLLVGKQLSS